jgi:hypothetical protein
MKPSLTVGLTLSLVAVLGCGGGGGSGGGAGGDDDGTGGGGADAAPPAGYTRLIGRTWSLAPGQPDTYLCVRYTAPADMYITSIQAQAPQGTHHTVLSVANTSRTRGADGNFDCGVGTLGLKMLYASGVGTSPLDFPDGVGIKIAAGEQLLLNLHLYNASDTPLSGESVLLVKSQPTPPPILAENVFAGRFFFTVPSNDMPVPVTGGCTAQAPYTLFAVWPHMHRLGRNSKLELVHAGVTTVLHDQAFSFLEQHYYRKDPMIQVAAGDQIKVTCTFQNNTGTDVTFGESTDDEMCFTGLYRYPATDAGLFQCTDNPSGAGL